MNYLEFAERLYQCFYAKMKPFELNILVTGTVDNIPMYDAQADVFAFSITADKGELKFGMRPATGKAFDVKDVVITITDRYSMLVGQAHLFNFDIDSHCDCTFNVENANAIKYEFNVNVINNMLTSFVKPTAKLADALVDIGVDVNSEFYKPNIQKIVAEINSTVTMVCGMEILSLTYVSFGALIESIFTSAIEFYLADAQRVNVTVENIISLVINAFSAKAKKVETNVESELELTCAMYLMRIALLSDYENDLLQDLETKTLEEMEYIIIQ